MNTNVMELIERHAWMVELLVNAAGNAWDETQIAESDEEVYRMCFDSYTLLLEALKEHEKGRYYTNANGEQEEDAYCYYYRGIHYCWRDKLVYFKYMVDELNRTKPDYIPEDFAYLWTEEEYNFAQEHSLSAADYTVKASEFDIFDEEANAKRDAERAYKKKLLEDDWMSRTYQAYRDGYKGFECFYQD